MNRTPIASVRVAAYTRQSVADSLQFGSLDAQREAIEAYVLSQRDAGWQLLSEQYDDRGFSGATTERPAFQRLIRDIEQGLVDVVAVHRIDRLSRSLADFARLMKEFESRGVAFTSVTQAFNTTSSAGRLTLGILATFAEFERAVIAERTSAKIVATRRRGLWTGGRPPLGYDVVDKKLTVNAEEAAQVRAAFESYVEFRSLRTTVAELDRRGIRTKSWTTQGGRTHVGRPISRSSLSALLGNPLYRGLVRCGDELVAGVHEAIIEERLWDAVQAQRRQPDRRGGEPSPTRNRLGALLRGLIVCGRCGAKFRHHFTQKRGREYRFYVCKTSLEEGAAACPGSRAAAGDLEEFVVDKVRGLAKDEQFVAATATALREDSVQRVPELQAECRRLDQEATRLTKESDRLLDAVAHGGQARDVLLERLAEVDQQRSENEHRRAAARVELDDCAAERTDEAALRRLLTDFDAVWNELFVRERERILRALIEEVVYHGAEGRLDIRFRLAGAAELATTDNATTP